MEKSKWFGDHLWREGEKKILDQMAGVSTQESVGEETPAIDCKDLNPHRNT